MMRFIVVKWYEGKNLYIDRYRGEDRVLWELVGVGYVGIFV